MKMSIESTSQVVYVNDIVCRVWEGITERGIRVTALIPRVAVKDNQDASQFEAELIEQRPPSTPSTYSTDAWPLRMVL